MNTATVAFQATAYRKAPGRLYIPATALVLVGMALLLNSDIRLPIFYENGLAHSIFPPVLIGIGVLTLGAELFGWTFSGLVAPGFLAPILIAEPLSAFLMIAEAVLTYYFILALSSLGARIRLWSEFFGRDRFFAILLGSVGVRLLIEGYAVKTFGAIISERLSIPFDYSNSLFSVGFVVVPLLANIFWNGGMRQAFIPVLISILLTFLITLYVLVDHTSFSVGYLGLIYEGAAIDFTASPKAHIVLLTAAFIASRSNLKYGWDFNGILVPSLLALIWFTPAKLIATIIEALLILAAARFISSRKRFEMTTLEGPRKIFLLFLISFLLKMALDATIGIWQPGLTAVDFYGFGYLLPTLIAAKMWQKSGIVFVLFPVLRTSLFAAVIGNLVGFSLTLLPLSPPTDLLAASAFDQYLIETTTDKIYSTALLSRGRIRIATKSQPVAAGSIFEIDRFAAAMDMLAKQQNDLERAERRFGLAAQSLKAVGYESVLLRDDQGRVGDILLREQAQGSDLKGWGLYIISANPRTNLIIEVPHPVREADSFDLGLILYRRLGARALLVAGAFSPPQSPLNAEYALPQRGIFGIARSKFSDASVLEVRTVEKGYPRLAVKNELPLALDLSILKQVFGDIELDLYADFKENPRATEATVGFAELRMPIAKTAEAIAPELPTVAASEEPIQEGYLYNLFDRLVPSDKSAQLPRLYPTRDEVIFFDEQLLSPIFTSASEGFGDAHLKRLRSAAAMIGYQLIELQEGGNQYMALVENEPKRLFGGTVIVKLGQAMPIIVEAPHPASEIRAFDFSRRLFYKFNARVLIISGSEYDAASRSDDNVAADAFFDLAHQRAQTAISRDVVGSNAKFAAPLALQIRSVKTSAEEAGAEIVVSAGFETREVTLLPPSIRLIVDSINRLNYKTALQDGSRERAAFSIKNNNQRFFSERYYRGSFAVIWLTGNSELFTRASEDTDLVSSHALSLRLKIIEGSLERWAFEPSAQTGDKDFQNAEPIYELLRLYNERHNIHELRRAAESARALGFEPIFFNDKPTGQGFLVLTRNGSVHHIMRVSAEAELKLEAARSEADFSERLSSYIYGKGSWLKIFAAEDTGKEK